MFILESLKWLGRHEAGTRSLNRLPLVLDAAREPWLAIDPKPLRGEREFALAPIVRSFEFGQSERATRFRLDRLSSELGLNRARVLAWTVAQTMAWSFESTIRGHHHETMRWPLRAR